jgi:hypothetical protein
LLQRNSIGLAIIGWRDRTERLGQAGLAVLKWCLPALAAFFIEWWLPQLDLLKLQQAAGAGVAWGITPETNA